MPQVATQHAVVQQRGEALGHARGILGDVEQCDRPSDQLVEPVAVRARGQLVGEQDRAGVGTVQRDQHDRIGRGVEEVGEDVVEADCHRVIFDQPAAGHPSGQAGTRTRDFPEPPEDQPAAEDPAAAARASASATSRLSPVNPA